MGTKSIQLAYYSHQEKILDDLIKEFQDIGLKLDIQRDKIGPNTQVVLTDVEFLREKNLFHLIKENPKKTILLSSLPDEANIKEILSLYPLHHLIGANSNNLISEIKNTALKMATGSIWGVEKYFDEVELFQKEVFSSKNINDSIDEMIAHFDFSSTFDSPVDYLKVMANELITNALYNAPGTESLSRNKEVNLEDGKKVLFTMGMDQFYIALCVKDNFGTLNRDKIIKSLERSFREKTFEKKSGGAGLGLYLTFSHSNQMIINFKENEKTEIICIIDNNKRFKKYRERVTSFHFHQEA